VTKKVQHSQTDRVFKGQEQTDAACIRAIRAGNKEGWDTLVQRHYQSLLNLATAICGNQNDAEDAVQETFLAVYQGLALFDIERPLKPWLNTITVRRTLNVCRMHRMLGQSAETVESIADEAATTSFEETNTKLPELYRYLQMLKPDYRTLLVLKYFQQCSYSEIAHILDWSEESVKSRLFMARTQLRQIMQRERGL
jgi:RNA polymerase sigma-70 factor, ECF subfamily